jgi:ABC-type dipeptide/oligopeptide/nickel transport system permease component
MGKYIIRRLLQSVIVILGVTVLAFITLHLAGDPTYLYVSERASQEEIIDARQKLGFDRPLPEQYLKFLGGMLRGDLGTSLRARQPALELILDRLPATIELTLFALILATAVAIPIGILRRWTAVSCCSP